MRLKVSDVKVFKRKSYLREHLSRCNQDSPTTQNSSYSWTPVEIKVVRGRELHFAEFIRNCPFVFQETHSAPSAPHDTERPSRDTQSTSGTNQPTDNLPPLEETMNSSFDITEFLSIDPVTSSKVSPYPAMDLDLDHHTDHELATINTRDLLWEQESQTRALKLLEDYVKDL
jgi:hypothetical protein